MKEAELQSWLLNLATTTGWRAWHVPMPVRPIGKGEFVPDPRGAGLPDLVLICEEPPRLIFAELKGDKGRLSDDQREFLRLAKRVADNTVKFDTAGPLPWAGERQVGVYAWTPADQPLIEQILTSKVLL